MYLDKNLYFILPSKGYGITPFQVPTYSLFVLQQAFYSKVNLTTTKPFWVDMPHRSAFITKFPLSFINADTASPGILVITSPELRFD